MTERPRSTLRKRKAPAVAEVNKARAADNIQIKTNLLTDVVCALSKSLFDVNVHAVALELFERQLLPRSIRQFNAWCSADLPIDLRVRCATFVKNANVTLKAHHTLLAACKTAIAAIEDHRLGLSVRPQKDDRIRKLERRLALTETLARVAQGEVSCLLVAAAEERETGSLLEARYLALEREASEAIEVRDQEIAALRLKNAELTSTLRKITSLGVSRAR
ncbi:hypothetical protein J2W25_001586 [Variovorax boronicumulans]|uniref:Uncharacterized protein n=1 Tax=Variovorax boronicumulans TaxID=436515 RepID=A0AAW8DSN5_9BURK|nr:hypothetical protein [Variovorax boronicumulans]MDP9876552.1 hypothetical protein [Variovorax boronicumulans]MDP9922571.1 hypothetical protein [Variovorax boronicumulans]